TWASAVTPSSRWGPFARSVAIFFTVVAVIVRERARVIVGAVAIRFRMGLAFRDARGLDAAYNRPVSAMPAASRVNQGVASCFSFDDFLPPLRYQMVPPTTAAAPMVATA